MDTRLQRQMKQQLGPAFATIDCEATAWIERVHVHGLYYARVWLHPEGHDKPIMMGEGISDDRTEAVRWAIEEAKRNTRPRFLEAHGVPVAA